MKIKNLFIQLLLAFFKPWIKKNNGNRFLVVSTTGLGDTLWGTPGLRALRAAFPEAYIGILTTPAGKEVLCNNPHINEVFTLQNPPLVSLLKLFPALKKRQIATVLVFHLSQRPVLPFCTLIGAGRIIGTKSINKGLDLLLTNALEVKKIHEIERRLQIVAEVKALAPSTSKLMELFPTSFDHQRATDLLPTGVVIGLHPGAKDRFKQWAPSHFIELGRRLQDTLRCQIVVTGTAAEKDLVETIAQGIDGARGIYDGVSLLTLAALLKRLSLYITNDTGPLHVASAVRTPTIALFTPTDPLLCGPYCAPHVKVIQKKPTCFPCLRKKCRDPFCMLQISPDEVLKMALNCLQGTL